MTLPAAEKNIISEKKKLSDIFNSLSWFDRWQLRCASLAAVSTAIIRDDTKKNPWKFPLYAVILTAMTLSTPIPGNHVIPIFILAAFTRLRIGAWSCWVDDRLRESWRGEVAMRTFNDAVRQDDATGRYKVHSGAAAKQVIALGIRDVRDTSASVFDATRRLFQAFNPT